MGPRCRKPNFLELLSYFSLLAEREAIIAIPESSPHTPENTCNQGTFCIFNASTVPSYPGTNRNENVDRTVCKTVVDSIRPNPNLTCRVQPQEANKFTAERHSARTDLSALKVKQIKEPGFHRDYGARGLYLQVTVGKNGIAKSWVYRFVSPVTGKSRWMGLGPVDAITLVKARELARAARETVKLGGDPIENRREEISTKKLEAAKRVTFGKCASDYITEHSGGWKNAKHVEQWKAAFEGSKGRPAATVTINSLPVAEIDTALVLNVLRPIWKKTPETASRIRGRIERVLAWATVSEYRKGENPARWRGHLSEMLPAKSKIYRVEHHKAIPYPELPAFMQRLRKFDSRERPRT